MAAAELDAVRAELRALRAEVDAMREVFAQRRPHAAPAVPAALVEGRARGVEAMDLGQLTKERNAKYFSDLQVLRRRFRAPEALLWCSSVLLQCFSGAPWCH